MTTNSTDILKTMEYYESLYANIFDSLDEMDKFLKKITCQK